MYFESNSYTLSIENKIKIDSLISQLSNLPEAYQLEIVGHADSVGKGSFNNVLSNQRADETRKYLLGKGFREEALNTEGRGFSDPVTDNQSEENQAKNRRVTVSLYLDPPTIFDIGGIQLDEKKFQFHSDTGGTFHHESGSSIEIPPRIFVDDKGRAIEGEIDFSYTEFRDPIDFILSGLPMNHKENNEVFHFNSSGMFRLLATHKGKAVHMKANSRIRVNFAQNKGALKTKVYRYVSSSGKWQEQSEYDHDYEDVDYKNWRMNCGGSSVGEPPPCPMTYCQKLYMMVRVGAKFTNGVSIREAWRIQDSNKVMELFDAVDSCYMVLGEMKKSMDSLQALIKRELHTYRISEYKRKRRKTAFTIVCQGGRKSNEMLTLKNIVWKYKRKEDTVAFRLLRGSKWTDCTISRNLNLFNIQLSNQNNSIELKHVKLKVKEKVPKKEKENRLNELLAEYNAKRIPYQNRIEDLREQLNQSNSRYNTQSATCEEMLRLRNAYIQLYYELRGHSIFCFFMHNYEYMTVEEKQLRFLKWLKYFDQHGAEMSARYQKILNSRELRYCREHENESHNPDPPSRPIVKIDIKSLGTFHFADLVQIEDTVEVQAEFRDEKQQPVWPVLVYLTDKTFNGVIRYDGSNRHGPYKFKISPGTLKALIAFDIKGRAYICSGKNLPGLLGSRNKTRLKFTLKLIKKPTSREDLLKEL